VDIRQLRIRHLRLIDSLDLELEAGWSLFTGPNGAGKTSLLEAAFLLSHARSFRTASRDALASHGHAGYSVFGVLDQGGQPFRAGLARERGRFEARLGSETVNASELLGRVAVVCFEPGSHALISGAAEERRRFLDWGVFHVEPGFLPLWRRYQRALRQRNALLRAGAPPADLVPWETELATAADPLSSMRSAYMDALSHHLAEVSAEVLVELGPVELHFDAGYDTVSGLQAILAGTRERDLGRGYTGAGPHRADWAIRFGLNRREHLSRGQEKLCAFACLLAQVLLFHAARREWPILCLDDLASELDPEHQARVLRAVDAVGSQVLVTGTVVPAGLDVVQRPLGRFHVEQGRVHALL
jgi:DNA replication and repair protein RecF